MDWRLYTFISFLILAGCKASSSDCDNLTYRPILNAPNIVLIDSVNTDFIIRTIAKKPFNSLIPYCLSSDTLSVYLNYISREGNLVRLNLYDSTDIQIFPVQFLTRHLVDMSMSGDSILLLDQESKRFYILKKSSFNNYTVIKDIDLTPSLNNSSLYIHFSFSASQFYFNNQMLYYSIGDLKDRNYLGKYSVVTYNIITGVSRIAYPYPECFNGKAVYDENIHFTPITNNKMIFCYNYTDVIKCFDSLNRITFEVLPGHTEPAREFEEDKEQNAAYVRKYVVTRDNNLGTMAYDSSSFFIFRKASTTNVNEIAKYYCNYFTNNGLSRSETEIKPLIFRNIIKFRKGFLLLSIDMKSVSRYEFN